MPAARSQPPGALRRVWSLLAAGTASWALGQVIWTWYETVQGREVPFPSIADIGYLGLPVLAAAALLSLPFGAQSWAGRARTLLDGLLVAGSLLLCSWLLVLRPVLASSPDGPLATVISLAYPLGDVVVLTIVVYAMLRERRLGHALPLSLPLLGGGLAAWSVSDTGFVYLTTSGSYVSGNPIDIGWFLGFAVILLAALQPVRAGGQDTESGRSERPLGAMLPYAAVLLALVTSVFDLLQETRQGEFVFWARTVIMVLLVVRQVLSLLENHSLTLGLEARVAARTRELLASQQRFAALVQHSSDLVTVVDLDGTIRYQSESSERLFGYPAEDVVGRHIHEYLVGMPVEELLAALQQASPDPTRVQTLHLSWQHSSGRLCRVETTITNLLANPAVGGLVLTTHDVTDRVGLEQQLTHQAFTDSLTGLPNRALFRDRLQHAFSRRGTATEMAVYFMDLDGFKAVNDTLGHSAGDELLVQVADRLRAVVRPSDTLARFGGDEFAILVDDLAAGEDDDGVGLAERLCEAVRQPFTLHGEPVHVAVSVGIARPDPDSADVEQLLRNADLAMYQAKAEGSGSYAVYDPGMHAGLVERVRLESDLRKALGEDQFLLHYQPMIDMKTGLITGMEALVRWQHPERGLMGPELFIPLAESSGLINDIGLWVLREACRQAVRWDADRAGERGLKISVNLAARQLQQADLMDQVAGVLAETGLPAHRLTLEMTESVLIDNRDDVVTTLEGLRAMGVRLAIDDFGTGYSSLSYLHRFPVDTLKIDRSFVERLSTGGDTALVQTILQLGQSMNLETVAEGIERPEELLLLRRQGCTTGQGYHFSRPLSVEDFTALLAQEQLVRDAGTDVVHGGDAGDDAPVASGPLQIVAGVPARSH